MPRSRMISHLPLFVAISVVLVFTGCGDKPEEDDSSSPTSSSMAPASMAFSSTPGEGVRVLDTIKRFTLQSEAGQAFGSEQLLGKVWIATFIFTRCQQTCPLQTRKMASLQEQFLNHPSSKDIHFVSISVDPTHDTPEILSAYAKKHGADPARWSFLTGKRSTIWNLCKKGFKLAVADSKDNPDAVIVHSQFFILLDRAQRIRGYYDSLNESALEQLKQDLELVLLDPPGPILRPRGRMYWPPEVPPQVEGNILYWPPMISNPPWVKERSELQKKTVNKFKVFHDFQFTDQLPESGITFVNKITEDAGKAYKGVHYDHGNGVVVADVDGDGLIDIYFVNQLGANHLYKNLGNGKFKDIAREAGVAVEEPVGVTASFADIDNDGDPDLYVTTVRGGNFLFENDGQGAFKDISKSSGLDYNGHSSAAVFFDYDRDGLLDLFLTNPGNYTTDEIGPGGYYVGRVDAFSGHLIPELYEQNILFRNTGNNRFVDVSREVGLVDSSWTGDASPIDANEDGWPDLYVLSMQGHDEYYENVEGKRFVKKSRELFPRTSWGAMGIKVFDFDNDGLMDIYVSDMHTDMFDTLSQSYRYWYAEKMKMLDSYPVRFLKTDGNHVLGNSFFHNEGNGRFKEISAAIGAENYWPWGLSVGDLNADGFEDSFLSSSMNFPFRYGINSVLLNNRGKEFLDSEYILGVEPRRDGKTTKFWFNIECGGEDKDDLLCKGRSETLEVWGALGTRSSVIFDLDNDGDLDIVTNEFGSEPMVLISNLAEKKPDLNFLKINLVGTRSNRDGLGARVRIKAGGQTYTKVQDGVSGYLSHSTYPLYFGLDKANQVDEIEVTWPSSGKQVEKGPIEINRVHTITEK